MKVEFVGRGDVTGYAADPKRREQVFGCLASLDFSGLLKDVRARMEVARGSLVQFDSVFPDRTKAAARFGLRVFGALEQVVATAGMWLAVREAGSKDLAQIEAVLERGVEMLMALLPESFTAFDEESRVSVAGLGGAGAYKCSGRSETDPPAALKLTHPTARFHTGSATVTEPLEVDFLSAADLRRWR